MKLMRPILLTLAVVLAAGTACATNFAILLDSSGDMKNAADDSDRNWIVIEQVSWAAPVARSVAAAPKPGAPAPDASSAYRAARSTPKPVVLSISTARIQSLPKETFSKGRRLGTIRFRDGKKVFLLHDAVVAEVKRTNKTEEITLNYSKIENAVVPDRARARMEGDPDRPVVTGRVPNAPSEKAKQPRH